MNEPNLVREQPRPSPGLTITKWLHEKPSPRRGAASPGRHALESGPFRGVD